MSRDQIAVLYGEELADRVQNEADMFFDGRDEYQDRSHFGERTPTELEAMRFGLLRDIKTLSAVDFFTLSIDNTKNLCAKKC